MLAFPWMVMQLDPHVAHSQSLCPFKMLTGFPCPGCGITKSIIFIYQGEFQQSLGAHAFGMVTVLASILYLLWILQKSVLGINIVFQPAFGLRLAYALAFILGSYHFLRLVYFVANHSFTEILRESIWA